jgi:hypothetical protein
MIQSSPYQLPVVHYCRHSFPLMTTQTRMIGPEVVVVVLNVPPPWCLSPQLFHPSLLPAPPQDHNRLYPQHHPHSAYPKKPLATDKIPNYPDTSPESTYPHPHIAVHYSS